MMHWLQVAAVAFIVSFVVSFFVARWIHRNNGED